MCLAHRAERDLFLSEMQEDDCARRVQWSGLYEHKGPVLMLLPGCGVRIAETEAQWRL